MKRSTCKILLGIGIIWLIVSILISSSLIQSLEGSFDKRAQKCKSVNSQKLREQLGCYNRPSSGEFTEAKIRSIFFIGIPSWILIIIALSKWNSEKKKSSKKYKRKM